MFILEYLKNSWWCFSLSFSAFEDRRRVPLKSLPVLSKILSSSLILFSHNCFDCENSFHPSGAIQESFQFDSPEPIISELFIPAFSPHSSNHTGASLKYSLISSWSLRSLVSNSLKYLHSFSNSYRWFTPLLRSFFNSYGGSFKISLPLLSYQFIHCFQIPPVVPSIPSQVCAISLLILSMRLSSMPNPLLVINLIWWRISIQ